MAVHSPDLDTDLVDDYVYSDEYAAEKEKPYHAANGHTMYQTPRYARGGRPIYSSAWASCTDNCAACAGGDPLPDY